MHVPLTEVILSHDGAELARATLPPGEYVIGSEAGVDLHAVTPLLSRQHARLTINYDHLLIEDLGSSNGTFVNERPLTANETTRLFPNQSIRLGDVTLEVNRQRTPSEPGVSLPPAQEAIRRHLPEEMLGDKRYAIVGIVAQGGMGAILDARQTAIDRTVAMKVMLESADEAAVLRFIDEAKITGQLDHPNIVPIHELGIDAQGQVFYTMKFVRGTTLKAVLAKLASGDAAAAEKYPLPVLLTIFQKVCDALAFAHSKGVIHRDLKPENLMLGDFGSVLVMDWGLAKVLGHTDGHGTDPARSAVLSARSTEPVYGSTMDGAIMGTPAYMSPEQARGEIDQLDARSDIYALGIILFEILHLRPAVVGRSVMEIVDKVTRAEIAWDAKNTARVPDGLLAVSRKALALDPAARYPRVEDFQRDLTAYQSGFATSAENAGFGTQILLALKRHKAVATSIAAALVVLAIVISVAFVRVTGEKNHAETERQRAVLSEQATKAAKDKAVASRKAADGLIRYMQYDLRDTLDKVGRLSLMQDVDERIARYRKEHSPEEGDLDAERERGSMLTGQGDVLHAQGKLAEALVAYREFQAIAERLTESKPDNTLWQRDLSISYSKIGDVFRDQGQFGAALESHRKDLSIRERLAKLNPDDVRWQRDLSVSYDRVGDGLRTQGERVAALKAYRNSLAIRERLAKHDAANVDWQSDLSIAYERIGDVLREQGQFDESLEAYRKGLGIHEWLTKQDPANADWLHGLSISYGKVGEVLRRQGELPVALEAHRKSVAIREQLAKQDPTNVGWEHGLSVSYEKVGDVLRDQDQFAAALEIYRKSLAIRERLVQQAPANADWQRSLATGHERVGDIAQREKRWTEAAESFLRAALIARPWMAREDSGVEWLNIFAYGAGHRWEVLRDASAGAVQLDRTQARTDLRTARDQLLHLRAQNRLAPTMDKNLQWIEGLLDAAENSADNPAR